MSKLISEAATGGVLYKKVLLEILKNLQENTRARVSATLLKRESRAGVFLSILQNF